MRIHLATLALPARQHPMLRSALLIMLLLVLSVPLTGFLPSPPYLLATTDVGNKLG
jgi:hypothetical protein